MCQHGQRRQAGSGDRHTKGGQNGGFDAIGQAAGKRRKQGLHNGLSYQNQPGALGGKAQNILKIEAQQKGDGKGCPVIDQSGQAGKGKEPVGGKKTDFENRIGYPQLPENETEKTRRTTSDEPQAKIAGKREAP